MKVNILHNSKIIVSDVQRADTFWLRFSGYMLRKAPHVAGLLFEPGPAIQTTFMRFDLDLVFLTKENKVVKVIRGIKPWRHTWWYLKSTKTLEVPAGVIPMDVKVGDTLEII